MNDNCISSQKTDELVRIGRMAWLFKMSAWGLAALAVVLAALLGLQLLWLMLAGLICSVYGFVTCKLRGVKAMTSTTLFDPNLIGFRIQPSAFMGCLRVAVLHKARMTTWIEVEKSQLRYLICILQTCGIRRA